jgi:hypothetical protein
LAGAALADKVRTSSRQAQMSMKLRFMSFQRHIS